MPGRLLRLGSEAVPEVAGNVEPSSSQPASARGRVLVIGATHPSAAAVEELSHCGFECAAADGAPGLLAVARAFQPEAVLLLGAGAGEREALAALRSDRALQEIPVLGDITAGAEREALRALGVDDWIHTHEELTARIEAALRARRLIERDALSRLRMEMLLEITQAATSSLELEEILSIAVAKVSRVVSADRCSVVLVEGQSPRLAHVVASAEQAQLPFQLDLAKYPELRRALETRQAIYVEDAARDTLMQEVRPAIEPLGVKSILVEPLICQEDLLGALFLRLSRSDGAFGRDEQEFARAAAAAIANSVRNARLHAALVRKRENLELAYVDRYKELGEANRRLKELNRLKDEIIAVCSHDLRAPLNVLLGHGRLLLEGALSEPQKGSVEAIVRQGKKILDLAESLLERGRGEQARLSLDPRLTDISELAKESAKELGILAAERNVRLRAETPESLMVIGDEVKLRQVLQNLVTNAISHARESGEVVVRSLRFRRPDGDVARLIVQDDGRGIPADQLHLVFDRYRHGPGEGTGLGLAICKEFVELHGGEVWAETPDTGGCAFVFTLPLAKQHDQAKPAPPPLRETGEQPRVLVVEDEPQVAAVVAEILRSRYRVEVARDGAEGLAKARALHPDLVVMDVFLPKLDGLDAALALKDSTDTADIPVVLLSAHQGIADKVRELNLGAVDYLAKPFQALELLACAERAIKLRETQRELERSRTILRRAGSDPETGLFNREGLTTRLDQEIARARRYQRPLCIAVLRPTRLLGDRVRAAASVIRSTLRASDVLGHVGNGTFALVLTESSTEPISGVVSRIATSLKQDAGIEFVTSVTDLSHGDFQAEVILEHLLGPVA